MIISNLIWQMAGISPEGSVTKAIVFSSYLMSCKINCLIINNSILIDIIVNSTGNDLK